MASRAQNVVKEGVVRHTDLEMVRRTVQGDPLVLKDLITRLQSVPRTLAYRNRKLGRPLNSGELEDLTQDVLGSIWVKLGDYSGRGSFDAWVYRFCVLALLSRLRKLRRLPTPFADAAQRVRDPLAKESEDRLEYEHIHESLATLDRREGDIIRLKHFEENTFEEISARLGMSKSTVKSRYYRGLIKLKRLLEVGHHPSEERP